MHVSSVLLFIPAAVYVLTAGGVSSHRALKLGDVYFEAVCLLDFCLGVVYFVCFSCLLLSFLVPILSSSFLPVVSFQFHSNGRLMGEWVIG